MRPVCDHAPVLFLPLQQRSVLHSLHSHADLFFGLRLIPHVCARRICRFPGSCVNATGVFSSGHQAWRNESQPGPFTGRAHVRPMFPPLLPPALFLPITNPSETHLGHALATSRAPHVKPGSTRRAFLAFHGWGKGGKRRHRGCPLKKRRGVRARGPCAAWRLLKEAARPPTRSLSSLCLAFRRPLSPPAPPTDPANSTSRSCRIQRLFLPLASRILIRALRKRRIASAPGRIGLRSLHFVSREGPHPGHVVGHPARKSLHTRSTCTARRRVATPLPPLLHITSRKASRSRLHRCDRRAPPITVIATKSPSPTLQTH